MGRAAGWVALLWVLSGTGALADGAAFPIGLATVWGPPPGPTVSSAELLELLAQRDAELRDLREFKDRVLQEEALYGQAEAMGIVKAVARSGLPARQQRRLSVAIVREAQHNGVDPLLVVAVIRCESGFDNYAVSPVGAMGLMQVMPDTGAYLAELRGEELGKTANLFDPELNVELGTAYLADLIKQFKTLERALVAYNAGPGAAEKILAKRETRRKFVAGYPKKVVAEFRKLKAAFQLQQARAQAEPGRETDT